MCESSRLGRRGAAAGSSAWQAPQLGRLQLDSHGIRTTSTVVGALHTRIDLITDLVDGCFILSFNGFLHDLREQRGSHTNGMSNDECGERSCQCRLACIAIYRLSPRGRVRCSVFAKI